MSLPDPIDALLARYEPHDGEPDPDNNHAAVAALLRGHAGELEVLLMTRAERPDDPWSGQVCMPGGAAEVVDDDLLATAVRETREELGFDLDGCSRLLCRLQRTQAVARGRRLPLEISPYVFAATAIPRVELGDEAADAFWFPLGRARRGELDGTYRYRHGEQRLVLPCWNHADRTVWGLTHRMLSGLLQLLDDA